MVTKFFARMVVCVSLAFTVLPVRVLYGAMVDEEAASRAAVRFLATGTGRSILADRVVQSMQPLGNLWVARLSPSGHILVSGSDHATPIIGFSANDFSEGEVGSPERAALDAAEESVAAAEADETKSRHAKWEGILSASPAKARKSARLLLGASGSGVNIEPFITSRYNQCQPWNDFAPVVGKDADTYYRGRSLAGCVSVADAALVRAVRWPVYPARTDTVTHTFRGGMFDIRFDGSAPFNWDLMQDTYPVAGDLRGTLAEDRRYEIGRLLMWLNHSARMSYNAGESTSTKYNAAHGGERDWYTIGRNMVPTAEGVEDIVTKTLAAGIPVFVGVGGHAVVADGWKTEDDEKYVDLVYGWGGAGNWYSLESGPVKYFWVEHYPRAKPQLDPIPKVVGDSVTLSWHFPDCYTNKVNGFLVTGKRRTSAALTTWTADFSNEATGNGYPADVWDKWTFSNEDGTVALDAKDLTYGFYQFSTPLTITENSVLSLKMRGGADSSGDACQGNVVIEICGDDGNWRELFVPECNWSNWPGSWRPNECSLADYAGQTIQLRIYKRHALYNGRVDIGDFKVTNVIPLEGGIVTPQIVLADAREVTLTGLEAGADYAFSVTPYLVGETLVSAEPSDAKVTTIAGTHSVPGTAVDATADYVTEESTITFSDSFQITEDSQLSCTWYADCSAGAVVQLKVMFTPENGEEEEVYSSTGKMKMGALDQTGTYIAPETANNEDLISLTKYAGVAGSMRAYIYAPYAEYGAPYDDIAASAVQSITVTQVHSSGVPQTETLTAAGMPEISSIQYQADGKALCDLGNGILADGAIGTMTIKVGCSENVTELAASPSHVELVDDSKVHIEKKADGFWYITFDPSIPENRNRQRQILTLHATDSNGTTLHKDIVMRMTTDAGIEGGAEVVEDDILLYAPKSRPIAVWNGDFDGATTRGAVTLNAQGNTVAGDGSTITKKAGEKGIDFAIADGGKAVLGIVGVSGVATTSEKTVTLMTASTTGTAEDAGIGISCESSTMSRYRGLLNSGSGQWSTAGNNSDTYPNDGAYYAFAFSADASGIEAWTDGESKYKNTGITLDNTAVTDLALGGWKGATAFGADGAKFNYVAIFTNATDAANDVSNWNLKNMTGVHTLPAEGGELVALKTGRSLGVNLNGGTVTLDEPIYAAGVFVQDDTTLNVSFGGSVTGSRVLYVAPGKALTVNAICDETALSNAVSAAGGVYTSRILQGANYGDIVAGSLPDIGPRYEVELEQKNTEGVYLRVTDTNSLNIYNDDGSDVPVGYITDGGQSCIITNATGVMTIPAMVKQVNIYAKDDTLYFSVAAGSSPTMAVYASNAAGELEMGSSWGLVLTALFTQTTSADGTMITLSLNPEAVSGGVKVRPEFDVESVDELLSFSGTGESKTVSLPVKIIPGLWYCVEYADNVAFENLKSTDPQSVTTSGTKATTLTAPATDDNTFYRVRVGASKASVQQ